MKRTPLSARCLGGQDEHSSWHRVSGRFYPRLYRVVGFDPASSTHHESFLLAVSWTLSADTGGISTDERPFFPFLLFCALTCCVSLCTIRYTVHCGAMEAQ